MQTAAVLSQEGLRKRFPAHRERYRKNWRQWRRARKLAAKAANAVQSTTVDVAKPIILSAVPDPIHKVREMVSGARGTHESPVLSSSDDVLEVLDRECGCRTVTCLAKGTPGKCGCDLMGASCSDCKDAHFNIPCSTHRGAHIRDLSVLSTREVRRYH
jgi:hypothetical protein